MTTTTAVAGSARTFGVLVTMEVAGGMAETGGGIDRFSYACFLIGLFGFVEVLSLLLLPFTRIGAAVVVVFEIILVVVYFSSNSTAASPQTLRNKERECKKRNCVPLKEDTLSPPLLSSEGHPHNVCIRLGIFLTA